MTKRKRPKRTRASFAGFGRHRCSGCPKMIPVVWKFCPSCQFGGKQGGMSASGPQRAGGGYVRKGA